MAMTMRLIFFHEPNLNDDESKQKEKVHNEQINKQTDRQTNKQTNKQISEERKKERKKEKNEQIHANFIQVRTFLHY